MDKQSAELFSSLVSDEDRWVADLESDSCMDDRRAKAFLCVWMLESLAPCPGQG